MAKPITDEQRREWAALHGQVLTLVTFFERKGVPFEAAIRAIAEPSHPYRSKLEGLREALADLLEMAGYLDGPDLRLLDDHVRQNLGIALDDLQAKRLARISAVRERGKITTDEQFRLLKGRFEQVWDNPAHVDGATELSALMETYESRRRRPTDST